MPSVRLQMRKYHLLDDCLYDDDDNGVCVCAYNVSLHSNIV